MASAVANPSRNPALRARQRVVENYSTSQVADRYEALFAEVLGGPGSL